MELEEIPLEASLSEEARKYSHLIEESDVPPPPEAGGDRRPHYSLRQRFANLMDACGWRFIAFLVVSQLICKGFLIRVVSSIMLPLFRDRVDASTLQIYVMLSMIPWSIKPIIGLCSDYILLCGYNKRGWLVVSWFVGTCSAVLLVVFSLTSPAGGGGSQIVLCFIGINFEIALYDLLSEGKYAEIRRDNEHVGSDFTTLTQALQMTGLLAGVCIVGFLSDAQNYTVMYIMALVCCVVPIGPTLMGWLPEERVVAPGPGGAGGNPVQLVDSSRFRQEWPKMVVVAICGLGGVTVSVLTTVIPDPAGPLIGFGVALVFLGGTLYGSHQVFADYPLISAVALYQVVTTLSQPLIGSELDYFYTATPECLADGPHFTYAYYISYTGIVGTAVALSGAFVYHVLLSKLRFRPVLLITTLLVSLAGLSDLMIVLRINTWIGIPDRVAYMVGEAVLEPLLGTLNWIPVSALITLAAPEGMEASCFAFLAGLSNFARMVSELSGSILIRFTMGESGAPARRAGARVLFEGIGFVPSALRAEGTPSNCDFSSLWWLVLMCHISFPLVVGVMATWLVPNLEQDEKVTSS